MANNLRIIIEYIKSDCRRYSVEPNIFNILKVLIAPRNHCLRYSIWLRLSSRKNIFQLIAIYMRKKYSIRYGIDISGKTSIGYGLYIGHGIGIVIHPTTVIGNNCNLSQFTTIGSNHCRAAVIGDNVYIGPSVFIVEDVKIGNNVTIGAGAVVVKNISDNATVVGVPAKVISYTNPGRYINNRWKVVY